MDKKEALKYEGEIVDCGCSWGNYYGYLKVLDRKPWRGQIEVLAVSGFPCPTWGRFVYPIKKGFIRDFGHCNVNITDLKVMPDYQQSMKDAFYKELNGWRSQLLSKSAISIIGENMINRCIKALENNEWLINHPDYYGGYNKEDIPNKLL